MSRRVTVPPIASPAVLSRLLAAVMCLGPLVFFGYYTVLSRWEAGDRALQELGGGPSIVVGVSVQRSSADDNALAARSQVYLVLPNSLVTLNAYSVTQHANGVHLQPIRYGLLVFGGLYGGWIAGSVWYLVSRSRRANT